MKRKKTHEEEVLIMWLPLSLSLSVCADGEFHCNTGRCLSPARVCDGYDDCGDLSDELNCGKTTHTHIHHRVSHTQGDAVWQLGISCEIRERGSVDQGNPPPVHLTHTHKDTFLYLCEDPRWKLHQAQGSAEINSLRSKPAMTPALRQCNISV